MRTSSLPAPGPPALAAAVLDACSTPLWVIGPAGTVAHVNRAAGELLGHPDRTGLAEAPSHEVLHPRHPDGDPYPADHCPIVRAARWPGPARGHERFVRGDGSDLPVAWSLRPLEAPGHHLLEFRPVLSPDGPGPHDDLDRVRRRVHEHAADPDLDPAALARSVHRSLRSLQLLLAAAGDSPAAMIRRRRLALAEEFLLTGAGVAEAARRAGFRDVDTFARAFRRAHSTAPGRWARHRTSPGR